MTTPAWLARPNSLEARDANAVVHGLTDLKAHLDRGPLVIESGHGIWVNDNEGREYIEAMSGLWCVSLGWGNARLVKACAEQMERLAYYHLTNGRSHGPVIELAEKLLEIAPVPMSRVWFANSGSEANDCAARLAWYYWNAVGEPRRRKIIAHSQAYHGNTIAGASLSGVAYAHESFNLPLPGFLHVACPHYFRSAQDGETEEEFSTRLVGKIEALIEREGAGTIAAFFTEPILAAGGVVVPPAGYFEKLQLLLKRHRILLVCDEVVTAFGRTGAMWGATTMGLEPDMLVCAKALSSAYFPISALLLNARVFDAVAEESGRVGVFGLTMTYSGHPVGAAVARETLRIYDEMDVAGRVRDLEQAFLGGLERLAGHPLVGDVRGRGLLAGVELAQGKRPRRPFDPSRRVGPRCAEAAERRGLLVRAIGDTISLCPPLIITEDEIAELLHRLGAALDETAAALA